MILHKCHTKVLKQSLFGEKEVNIILTIEGLLLKTQGDTNSEKHTSGIFFVRRENMYH